MKITTILFNLDRTLLPMDNDEFIKGYFKLLVKKLAPYGYEPQKLIDGIWAGTATMVKNDGTKSNEQAFWDKFSQMLGEKHLKTNCCNERRALSDMRNTVLKKKAEVMK